MDKKKAVLAYSGGLDTSCILRVLQERGYDVVAFIANVGQQEDFEEAARRAEEIGAAEVRIDDLRERFVTEFILPAVAGNRLLKVKMAFSPPMRP